MDAFEYAIKKDIRNNAIVREIDHARHRELWRWTAVAALIFALLFVNAWQHFELLRHGYAVARLESERNKLTTVQRSLVERKADLESPARIAEFARKHGMVLAGSKDTVVLQRAVTAAPPAPSVVASR